MIDKQTKIDLICTKVCGWHRRTTPIETVWWWASETQDHETGALFDPFTNPSDTARVMDEVVKQGCDWILHYDKTGLRYSVDIGTLKTIHYGQSETSWMEAFCEAVLAMIGEG